MGSFRAVRLKHMKSGPQRAGLIASIYLSVLTSLLTFLAVRSTLCATFPGVRVKAEFIEPSVVRRSFTRFANRFGIAGIT